jgi:hypothetical protein
MLPPVYQYVITLVLSLPIRRGPGVLMNVSVREHLTRNYIIIIIIIIIIIFLI